jgi:hypothetical protein
MVVDLIRPHTLKLLFLRTRFVILWNVCSGNQWRYFAGSLLRAPLVLQDDSTTPSGLASLKGKEEDSKRTP